MYPKIRVKVLMQMCLSLKCSSLADRASVQPGHRKVHRVVTWNGVLVWPHIIRFWFSKIYKWRSKKERLISVLVTCTCRHLKKLSVLVNHN